MTSKKPLVFIISGSLALAMAAAVVAQTAAGQPTEGPVVTISAAPQRLPGSAAVAPAPADPGPPGQPFDEATALARLSLLAEERLAMTVAAEAPGAPALRIDGRTIRLSDLSLVELRRIEDTTRVVSAGGTTNDFPAARTVWVATWQREGVPMEEWKIAGSVRAELVMEDGSGKLLAASVAKFNPNARAGATE